jgi:hypothetical protein
VRSWYLTGGDGAGAGGIPRLPALAAQDISACTSATSYSRSECVSMLRYSCNSFDIPAICADQNWVT